MKIEISLKECLSKYKAGILTGEVDWEDRYIYFLENGKPVKSARIDDVVRILFPQGEK